MRNRFWAGGLNDARQPEGLSLNCKLLAFGRSVALVLTVALGLSPTAGAQGLDVNLLKNLQGRLGNVTQSMSTPSPVDDSRNTAIDGSGLDSNFGTMTDSERELKDREAQQLLKQFYEPSVIEREYQRRTGDKTLRQFGYELFQTSSGKNLPLTGRVSGNYIVGVGDEFIILFQGPEPRSVTTRVDREGRLVVHQLPPVYAAGRRFDEVVRDIQQATRQTMLGTEAHVSLGAVRSIAVVVGGEVERPGQYNLTSLSDITHVLNQAKGIKRSGSLRLVRVERGGSSFTVDLYGLLGIGKPPLIRLQDGDRIIVPTVGRTIAITGSVVRPGIFEMKAGEGGMTLGQAIAMAGGTLRPGGNDYSVVRILPDGQEKVIPLTSLSEPLRQGDILQVMARENQTVGKVTLSGYVDNPGARSLAAAPTVSALLGSAQNLKMGSYLPMAVLIRRDPISNAPVYTGVNLYSVFHEKKDVRLQSEDKLILLGTADIAFLQSQEVRNIVLGQPNTLKECKSLAHLEMLVKDSQSDRFSAVTRGSFLVGEGSNLGVASGAGSQSRFGVSNAGELQGETGEDSFLSQQAQMRRARGLRGGVVPVTGGTGAQNKELGRNGTIQSSSLRGQSDDVINGDELSEDGLAELCPRTFDENPAVLPFLLENIIVVGGNIRKPGIYPVWDTLPIPVLASVAEGLASRAKSFTIDLTRADPNSSDTQQSRIEGTMETLASVSIAAGDDVRFNTIQPQYEVGAVLLTGEFMRPGLYTIRKGETLSQLIARAGGLTEYAYPYGAVFTRRSVKQAQQEGFKRTARELNTALLAVSARKNVSSDALATAASLAQSFATVDAPGRMVVEADPEVLKQHAEADTVLEAGDAIYMPKKPNFVLALGDVLNPGALQFSHGKGASEYIKEAGGIQRSADKKRAFIVYPNGVAQPLNTGGGWLRSQQAAVPPGSTIVVPKDIDPLYTLDIVKDVATIVGQFATTLASVAVLASQ